MLTLPVKNRGSVSLSPGKIICMGLNYLDHINESESIDVSNFTNELPEEPVMFAKTLNVLIKNEENIIIPKFIKQYNFPSPRVDYEAELAVIIKDTCKNVSEDEALEHVFGYTCFNDVSQRNFQKSEKGGWFRGKSLDTFGPIGPQIVKPEDIGDPQNLNIQCRLNGKTVQNSNTSYMIFNLKKLISFVSMNFTLNYGDIISTGTPNGVGPVKDGDVVEIEIENIGVLKNSVVEET